MKAADYRRKEGVIALPRALIRSPAYKILSLPARCLIVELQNRWAPNRPAVNFSTREAGETLRVGQATAVRAFEELARLGFIDLATPADHGARKARGWRLTWNATADGREPTDEWAQHGNPAIHHRSAKPESEPLQKRGPEAQGGP